MNQKKKIALLTLPALALVLLGSSVANAQGFSFDNLLEAQQSAIEEARELRREGSREEAKKVLLEAGLDPEKVKHRGHGFRGKHTGEMSAHHKDIYDAVWQQ